MFSDMDDEIIFNLEEKIKRLNEENEKMRRCLQEIADEDYRGNRNPLSVKAYNLLQELK